MTQTQQQVYRRRFPALPPDEYLSPDVRRLHGEATSIEHRRRAALTRRESLSTGVAAEEAVAADRAAAAAAVRAGKSAASVGTPQSDALLDEVRSLDLELDALVEAAGKVERELHDALGLMQADDKTSGRSALKAAAPKYAKALATLATARTEYWQAKLIHDFLAGAACLPGETIPEVPWKGMTVPGVDLRSINSHGERVDQLRPLEAEELIARTFALELEN